jgi:cytochrome c-type biogenesis protein CcmF
MALAGIVSLVLTFAAVVVSLGALVLERVIQSSKQGVDKKTKERYELLASRASLVGYCGVFATALLLTFGCALLVYCFLTGDVSFKYVVQYRSDSSSVLAPLYLVAGLWGGREGSLLFWVWLISIFSAVVAFRHFKERARLDNTALVVLQLVTLAFVAVLLFSESNMPFMPLDPMYLDANGNLKGFFTLMQEYDGTPQSPNPYLILGMNSLLEHWAMAIHPPTLFIGYAGLTVPFAYAIAALIANDPSRLWVERSERYALFSWVFLGLGIGLGALWAYVVLGWGGYWGWDPVENASLLSWLIAVALVHSFTVYRQHGAFKRWSILCACLAFAFVIVGTFITRSGIVQNSVHAFEGDPVSLILFLALIILSLLAGIIGISIRWKRFGTPEADEGMSESLFTKSVAYYFNNVILVVSTVLILYLTLASALPPWMPFGGLADFRATYNAIARPLGILYCLLMAIGPLLSWAKADARAFFKKARVPGIFALGLFALLVVYFAVYLKPSYDAVIATGGTRALTMLEAGPSFYYFALTLTGFFVASLLFFNSLFMLGRIIRSQARVKKLNPVVALFSAIRERASSFGGFLAHLSMSIILVGLIGSSMYVTQVSGYLSGTTGGGGAPKEFTIQDYRLVYSSDSVEEQDNNTDTIYNVTLDVYKGNRYYGQITPGIRYVNLTQQHTEVAAVMSFPLQDLFVSYSGVNDDEAFSITAYVNPLIYFVWIGFALLMVGTIIATFGRRRAKTQEQVEQGQAEKEKAAQKQPTQGRPKKAQAEKVGETNGDSKTT